MKYLKTWSVLFATLLSVGAFAQQAQSVMLPNGWRLTPAGKHLPLGDLPLNMAVSPNGRWLAVTNNGYGRQCVKVFDTKKQVEVDDQTIRSSWYGLTYSPDGKTLYVSGGNDNQVNIYQVANNGKIHLGDSIVLGKKWPVRISPAGLAVHPKTGHLYIVTRWDNSLYIYDPATKRLLTKAPLGGEGYQVLVSADGKHAYASCWGCDQVKVWDVAAKAWSDSIPVGSHPNEMCLDERNGRLFVANANDNSVSVVNLRQRRVEETLNAALFSQSLPGSTTNLSLIHI